MPEQNPIMNGQSRCGYLIVQHTAHPDFVTLRADAPHNPEFWAEVMLTRSMLVKLLAEIDDARAMDLADTDELDALDLPQPPPGYRD